MRLVALEAALWEGGREPPTAAELAAEAGLELSTVDRALEITDGIGLVGHVPEGDPDGTVFTELRGGRAYFESGVEPAALIDARSSGRYTITCPTGRLSDRERVAFVLTQCVLAP